MRRYIEIAFRSKLRLLALVLALPLAVSAINLYIWRSYDVTEVLWVDDPSTFGQAASAALGYNPYLTPSQNAVLLVSNLLGTQSFNSAMADKLQADGVIHTDQERAAVMASLSQLTVTPGGSSSAATNTAFSPNLIMTVHYICSKEAFCLSVLGAFLDVYRVQYSDLKARAAATARGIYEKQLTAAQAAVATAVAALQRYDARSKASGHGQPVTTNADPARSSLQHDIDGAERQVDVIKSQLQNIDTFAQVSNGVTGDMVVLDPPKTQRGLYGIRGLRSDNLKTDAIALAVCLLMAVAYLVLVAFLDRTVREPDELKKRLGKAVVTIPEYQKARPRRGGLRKKPA